MSNWKTEIEKKRQEIADLTPNHWLVDDAEVSFEDSLTQKLSLKEKDITEKFTVTSLSEAIRNRSYTAVEVVTAFSKRAALVNQYTNCLTEVNYESALKRAEYLDTLDSPLGPLHGIPISVKDSFEVSGLIGSLGCVSRLNSAKSTHNSPLVQMLLDLGAVVHVKTNIPQGIVTSDSHNNVFGRTLNPYNRAEWSAGGSSGGEAVLIALRGSLLGIGTDLGGSIRIPAWTCGVYGFKPTTNRLPYSGIMSTGIDQADLGVIASAGPLSTNLQDINFFMKTIIDHKPWVGYDSLALPMTWDQEINKTKRSKAFINENTKLVVGLILEDDQYPVDSEVQQNIQNISFKLTNAGHKVIQLLPGAYPSFRNVSHNIAFPLLDIDSERTSLKTIASGNEPLVPSVKKNLHGCYHPESKTFDESEELYISEVVTREVQFNQFLEVNKRKLAARKAWIDSLYTQGIDVLILPCAAQFAPSLDTYTELPYTNNWNALDFPAISIPTNRNKLTKVDCGVKPKGIQIVGTYYNDEGVLAAATIIDKIANSE